MEISINFFVFDYCDVNAGREVSVIV